MQDHVSQSSTGSQSSDKGRMYQSATFRPPSNVMQLELEDYVRELVAEMSLNIRDVESTGAIAVTNFVFSDIDYQSTNQLGYALADTFMMELHRFGFKTLDFKVTDYIRITSQGDFAMSRDYLELEADIPVDYVLVGKITDYKMGYKVLARIVDIKSKAILASGESLIPKKLVNMLISEEHIQPADFTLKVSS
jgi:TolB-like protein